MNLGAIDLSATAGRSWLHSAPPLAKLSALALVLAAVIVSWNVVVLFAVFAALVLAAGSARVPGRLTTALAAYPAIFAAIFAFASAPDLLAATTIVLKAVTAALAAVLVILTTPYPQVFAPIQRIVPSIVGDALLMTYRSAFLLLGRFGDTLRTVRLRSGLSRKRPVKAARDATLALGSVLLYSVDLAQRDYDVLRLRGYDRRLRVSPLPRTNPLAGALAILSAGAMCATAVLWRIDFQHLNPWSWLALVPVALAAPFALFARRRNR